MVDLFRRLPAIVKIDYYFGSSGVVIESTEGLTEDWGSSMKNYEVIFRKEELVTGY